MNRAMQFLPERRLRPACAVGFRRAALIALCAAGLAATVSAPARAQGLPWVTNPFLGDGIGIREGGFEIHPSVEAQAGYDTNYWMAAGTVTDAQGRLLVNEPIIPSFRYQIVPSFRAQTIGTRTGSTRTAPLVNFGSGGSLTFNQAFPLRKRSDTATNLGGQIGADAAFFPRGVVGFNVGAGFEAIAQPNTDIQSLDSFDRQVASGSAAVVWRPGGGAFSWSAGYEFRGEFFNADVFGGLNYVTHNGTTRGSWQFLPRTSLSFDASAGVQRYTQEQTSLHDSTQVRARVGLLGQLTRRVKFMAIAGFASGFYYADSSGDRDETPVPKAFTQPIGTAQVTYALAPGGRGGHGLPVGPSDIGLKYEHAAGSSTLGDYLLTDSVQAALGYYLGFLVVNVNAGVTFAHYQKAYFPAVMGKDPQTGTNYIQTNGFTAPLVTAGAFAEYRVIDMLGVNLQAVYTGNLTSCAEPGKTSNCLALLPTQTPNEVQKPGYWDDVRFSRFTVFAGVRWFM